MNRVSLLAMVVAMTITGSLHAQTITRMVDLDNPYAESRILASINDINQRARRRNAFVTLADSRVVKAQHLQVAPDSTSWFEAKNGLFESVATAEVKQIRLVRPPNDRKAVGAAVAGAVAGAAVGVALGYASGDDNAAYTAEYKALLGGGLLGAFGAALGALTGQSRSDYVYRFHRRSNLQQQNDKLPIYTRERRRNRP